MPEAAMAIRTQITNLILDRLVDHLTRVMQTGIDSDDPTRADVVKKGLLQEGKIEKNVALGIQGGDHEDPKYMDGIQSLPGMADIHFAPALREIGGGQAWWRRGVVQVECFFIKEGLTENLAHEHAYAVLGRLQNALDTCDMNDLSDDYGEQAIKLFCYGNTFFGSGGPPRTYIFRGKVFWAVWTERPF